MSARADLGAAQLAAFAADARSRAPKNAGEIGIFAEVDCRLSLDREPIGGSKRARRFSFPWRREHDVRASSRGGRTVHSESVKVKKGRIARVDVSAPARTLVDRANRTAEDLSTGLMWQLADNGGDITQKAAAAYCENASNGGYSDWRLPSIYELEKNPARAGDRLAQTISDHRRRQFERMLPLDRVAAWRLPLDLRLLQRLEIHQARVDQEVQPGAVRPPRRLRRRSKGASGYHPGMEPARICLWSGPRNVSTALMYSFAQRPDTRVVDEPLYGHYLR